MAGQSLQPVTVRVTDMASPPNPVAGASVVFQSAVERMPDGIQGPSGGDTTITRNPTPVILASTQTTVVSDTNGLASFLPSAGGFDGALQIAGSAMAGVSNLAFAAEVVPPTP